MFCQFPGEAQRCQDASTTFRGWSDIHLMNCIAAAFFSLFCRFFKPEICEAYLSREEFHREKHYDFCSKQVPLWCLQMFVISTTLRPLSSSHSKKMKNALNKSMTFDIATQVLSVYTTFPRFLFPREDHRGKARQVDSTVEVGGKSPTAQELRRVRSPVEEPGANADRTPPGSTAPPPVAVGAPRCESMVPHTGSTVSIFYLYFGTIQQHHSTHFCGVSFTWLVIKSKSRVKDRQWQYVMEQRWFETVISCNLRGYCLILSDSAPLPGVTLRGQGRLSWNSGVVGKNGWKPSENNLKTSVEQFGKKTPFLLIK